MDGISTGQIGARVAARGAARRRTRLRGGVGDLIATIAAALESVVQAQPVADLVRRRLAQVVRGVAAAGPRLRGNGAAVEDELLGALAGLGGEVAASQIRA